MAYTFNVKRLEEVEKLGRNECTLSRWPRLPVMSDCSRSTSKFKVIQLIVNPPIMVYNTENGASLQKLAHQEKDRGKRYWISDIIFGNWEKRK